MIRLAACALLLSASVLAAAPVPKELLKEFKTEGLWEMVSIDAFGRALKHKEGLHWSFDDKGFMTSSAGPGTAAIKSSLQFTFHPEERTVEYRTVNGTRICPGLFKMEGDTLVICCNLKANGERPKIIGSSTENYVWTMKRVKGAK